MARRGKLVVVVDDELLVLRVARTLLEGAGYTVRCYSSAEALLESDDWRGAAVAVIDVGLPGMNGRELAETMRQLDPGIRVAITSGATQHAGEIPKERLADELVSHVGGMIGNGHA